MKRRITIAGRAKNYVEHDQTRASCEQSIEQKRPDFARPRERLLGHQLKRAIVRDFFRRQWR